MRNEDKTAEKLKYEKPAAVKFQFANDDVILASGGGGGGDECGWLSAELHCQTLFGHKHCDEPFDNWT